MEKAEKIMNGRRGPDKRRIIRWVLTLLGIAAILLLPYGLWKQHQSAFLDGRPAEALISHAVSPDGLHALDVYRNGGKGATVADSGVVILSALDGGETWKSKDKWCLYYAYRYPDLTAAWLDSRTVLIHNADLDPQDVALDIYQDEYAP